MALGAQDHASPFFEPRARGLAEARAEQQHALLSAQIREATAIAISEATLEAERAKGALRAAITAEVEARLHLGREMLRLQSELDRITSDLADRQIANAVLADGMNKLTDMATA